MPKAKKKKKVTTGDNPYVDRKYLAERSKQARAEAAGDQEDMAEHAQRHSVSYVGPRDGSEEEAVDFAQRLEAAAQPEVVEETTKRKRSS